MYSESQYCFANISATKAWVFMKFYMVVNYHLVSLSFKFHADWCINARARAVKARAHVLSRLRAFMPRARASVHGSSVGGRLLSYEHKSKISERSEFLLRR